VEILRKQAVTKLRQDNEIEVRKMSCARGDGACYQYPAVDKVLIDYSPKANPDN
uniref:Uncharacterized protein n=1 Tax=Canis lupus dingo TaxID=286419 RepID=A0A8C0K939_CANLU